MERGQDSVARRFVDDLSQLRQRAGQPSYSTLERLSGHRLKRATMSDVLNGNRVKVPDWRFIHEFVTACRSAATENRLDVDQLGTVADWKRHWDGVVSGVIDARFPGHSGQQSDAVGQIAEPPEQTRGHEAATAGLPPVDSGGGTAARPSLWGRVPSRLPDFVGREGWLATLRQALTRDDRIGLVAIQGLPGVGKTQLAAEYATRYAHEYDLVWWVPCRDVHDADSSLIDLAVQAGSADWTGEPADRDYSELFDVLRRHQRFERWLLIFDGADEPEDVSKLIPPLPGDVLITTRSTRWEASGELLELDAFDRKESIEFLRRRMPTASAVVAHQLADGVGDLPLFLEHAAESHIAVDTYLARLNSDPLPLLADQPADYHSTIGDAWHTAIGQLRTDAPEAFDLLCCLASFGTEPVPRDALERGGFLPDVSIHSLLRDSIRVAGAIGKLRRAGLLRVSLGPRSLAVHRVTRYIVRALAARSDSGDRSRHDVHLLLAAADPRTPDDPTSWQGYEPLHRHAIASEAVACEQELVREFVVNLTRYLTAAGDTRSAIALADEAITRWSRDTGENGVAGSGSRVMMRAAKVGALFVQGSWTEAFQLHEETLAKMREDRDRWSANIVELAGMTGARHRIAGNFAEAVAADRDAMRAHVAEFGNDDPRTFSVVHSLITDLALSGAAVEASVAARELHRNCLAFYGDTRHPAVLAARGVLGRCRWLAGDYGEAARTAAEVRSGYAALPEDHMLDENHPWRLSHETDSMVIRRDNDPTAADLRVLADEAHELRRRCWRARGADHPRTLASTVVLASVLRRIDDRKDEAMRLLEEAERRYQAALPNHPYGYACAAYLAVVRSQTASGRPQQVAAQSVRVMQDMTGRLADSVGSAHPLSLTARSALANALARAGDFGAAAKHAQAAAAGLGDLLGPAHPLALAAEANAEAIHSALSSGSRLQADLADIDFTPLPL
jgi:tetratricopeptide (TPR) repeat protein